MPRKGDCLISVCFLFLISNNVAPTAQVLGFMVIIDAHANTLNDSLVDFTEVHN